MSRKKRRTRGKKNRPSKQYYLLPLMAFTIFWLVCVLIKTGLAAKIEDAVASFAQSDALALLTQREPPAPVEEDDRPETLDEPEPPAGTPTMRELPWTGVLDSSPPVTEQQPAEDPPRKITIDGSTGSAYTGSGSVYMRNNSKYKIDLADYKNKKSPVKLSGDGVQVLIVHTHGSEAYTPDVNNRYEASDLDRTLDLNYNVVRVGTEIAKILEENGVKTVHSTALHDSPAYSGSYNRALEDIAAQIKKNPSIKVVIDVHRDAVTSVNGTKYKTVASIDGVEAAQLMFVTGTDGGGLKHPNWKQNFTFQLILQDRLNTKYPGLMRPINIRDSRFNQHVTTGSMLLEVGTNGNTLDEALYSARLFAQVLADTLNESR